MTITHCRPTGALAADEIPVCNVSKAGTSVIFPSGLARGVMVFLHGLSGNREPVPPGLPTANTSDVTGHHYDFQFMQSVVADGWIYITFPYPEDYYSLDTGAHAVYNSISSDPNHGSIYINNTTMLWWDHVVRFIQRVYGGPTVPIIVAGGSWGGWHTLQIVSRKKTRVAARVGDNYVDAGYCAFIPATFFENISPGFTAPLDYSVLNASGLAIPVSALDSVDTPGAIGSGQADEAVGWSGTTVTSGSNGVDTSTFTGSGTLNVVSTTNIVDGPLLMAYTSGGAYAVLSYTGRTSTTLTGVKRHSGTGVLATGGRVTQNNTADMVVSQRANNPSNQVAYRAGASQLHETTPAMATFMSDWVHNNVSNRFPAVF